MSAWLRDIRYRLGSWILGDTWHIPRRDSEAAYLVIDSVGIVCTFRVKDLKLEIETQVPALSETHKYVCRSGTFTGTIGDWL